MSTEVIKILSQLEKSLKHCLIRDRHAVRSAIRRIEKAPAEKQQDQLAKLVTRVENSQKAVAV